MVERCSVDCVSQAHTVSLCPTEWNDSWYHVGSLCPFEIIAAVVCVRFVSAAPWFERALFQHLGCLAFSCRELIGRCAQLLSHFLDRCATEQKAASFSIVLPSIGSRVVGICNAAVMILSDFDALQIVD